ncbi:54S ribosomal protein L36, mitochondrial [Wickerhamomyces ciferrii]|uniref:54S ribosomal protein L36, mitochondrial n=1 Tax=Wickerhamomyces ciferrii (strain ATCC 14091 / BCRC 22168 / CBS 111 / JCM 3599 / NBRC 0793 / NRRL Y-1031 F-60-10) TaxID=1206466 RepID=K0KJ33_WICCF|nr:54S ribosomal protein L36, mitochondrial [Wickerhamomyces ciferrii]CCH45240.1 54S ribosomal protein L36, mitochondrial [Wickerhamomyces ciferrii]
MFRPTIKSIPNLSILGRRLASGRAPGQATSDSTLKRRPLKKIKLGKARPAIYYQFNCKTELSDGSVIIRRSQYPKDELRLIQDQRNHPLWNPNRVDLEVIDPNAGGRIARFKQKFSQFDIEENIKQDLQQEGQEESNEEALKSEKEEEDLDNLMMDEYLELLGQNVQEVQKGGKVQTKASRRRK